MEKAEQSKIMQLLNELAAAKKAERAAHAAKCAAKEAEEIARRKEQIRPLFDVYETLKAAGHGDSVMTEPRVGGPTQPISFTLLSRFGSKESTCYEMIPLSDGRWEVREFCYRLVGQFDSMTEVTAWLLDRVAEGLSYRK